MGIAALTGRRWPVVILPALCAVLVYAETLQSPFQYDDWVTVVDNPALTSAWAARPWSGGGYRPVTMTSYFLDSGWRVLAPALFLDGPTSTFHATNVILHGFVVGLVAAIGLLWWSDPLAAGVAALIVAVHPFNAEAVNYISARASLLAACWELAALGAYTLWARSSRRRPLWLATALGSALLAMGSKESAITLPLLIWLVDYAVIDPDSGWHARVRRLWPWFALSGVFLVIRLFASSDVSGSLDYSEGARGAALLTALATLWLGARDWLWPSRLSVEHGVDVVSGAGGAAAVTLTVMAFLLIVWSWGRRHRGGASWDRIVAFALAWWTFCALPAMVLPFMTHVALYQENRFYLAGAAPSWALGWVVAASLRPLRIRWGVVVPAVLGGLTLVIVGYLTHMRNDVWKTEPGLWVDAVKKAPGSALAWNMLGAAYLAQGWPDRAVPALEEAVRLDPRYPRAANNLGAAYAGQQRWNEAVIQFQRTLALDPAFEQAKHNLADAYEREGRLAESISVYEEIEREQPDDPEVLLRLGGVALRLPDLAKAERAFLAVLARDSRSYPALFNLGLVAEGGEQWDNAKRYYRQALSVNAADPDVHFRLGLIASRTGRSSEAISAYQDALRLAPGHYLAHINLAQVFEAQGQRDLAAEHYRDFMRVVPQTVEWTEARTRAESRLRELGR